MKILALYFFVSVCLTIFISGCFNQDKGQTSKEQLKKIADSVARDIGTVKQVFSGKNGGKR